MVSIAFIQPKNIFSGNISPPLGLLRLASLTPKDHDIRFVDENAEKHLFEKVDIAAITVQTVLRKRAYEIADRYRQLGSKVILGGIHASFMPDEAIEHADSVVVGEADDIWKDVLADYAQGKLKKFYKAKRPVLRYAPVDWSLTQGKGYIVDKVIQTSRGCPFSCDFCSVTLFNGKEIRHFPVEDIIKEVERIGKRSNILFCDDNITYDKEYAKKLFSALIPFNIRWFSQASITIADDEELLDLAYRSGCRYLFLGLESVSQKSLDCMNKPFQLERYEENIRKIKKRGILVHASMILGNDSDDDAVIKECVDFCIRNADFALFNNLVPFPGTGVYDKLKKEGRLRDGYIIVPKDISSHELYHKVIKANLAFYSPLLIIKRALDVLKRKPRAFPLYLAASFMMRKGVIDEMKKVAV